MSDANSDPDGARIQTQPTQVQGLTEINEETSEERLVFSWTEMTAKEVTGGTQIISYNVQWDGGSAGAAWSHLAGFTSNFIGGQY